MIHRWSKKTAKRAAKDRRRKVLARRQRRHLEAIKGPEELRRIDIGHRWS